MFSVRLISLLTGIAAIIVGLALTLGPARPDGAGAEDPLAVEDEFAVAIDADAQNGDGPCDPIDEEASVPVGATHQVGVCIVNQPEPPRSFVIRVVYDGELNSAPDVEDVLPGLDANPDANAGKNSFSSPDLGPDWNCTGLGVLLPSGDDKYTPDKYDAILACYADLVNPVTTLTESGPLAVITFEVVGDGDDQIEFDILTEIGGSPVTTIGTCGDVEPIIPCRGAVIHKGEGAPRPAPTAEGSPEVSPGAATPAGTVAMATPEGMTPAGEEAAPEADEEGGFPWVVLGGALGGAVLLLLIAGGLYAWRRA